MRSVHSLRVASLTVALLSSGTALAQTTGAIFGRVVDKEGGAPMAGVTVVATGPQGDESAITGEDGAYEFRTLPIGSYAVRFYYGDVTVEQSAVVVSVDKTVRVDARVPAIATSTVRVEQRAPVVDVGSTRVGTTLTQDFIQNVPTTFTLSGILEKAPGAFFDPPDFFYLPSTVGLSYGGATGAENQFMLDGVNVTSIGFGVMGTDPLAAFVDEAEIITGGYNAEYGRAMGGVVNIVTKSGTNEWKGSAFGMITPGFLTGSVRRINSWSTSLTGTTRQSYSTNFGVEVGGPIVKNRLFFWGGYAPELGHTVMTRYVNRFVDNDHDGFPDAAGGAPVLEELGRSEHGGSLVAHNYAAKLTWRVAPEHTLTVGTYGSHRSNQYLRFANATPETAATVDKDRRNDVTARWVSKLFDHHWQIEVNGGLHSEDTSVDSPYQDIRDRNAVTWLSPVSLAQFQPEYMDRCPVDMMTSFMSCPALGYQSGGYGTQFDRAGTRWIAQLKSTHLFRGGGWHQLKYGGDVELNSFDSARSFSGPTGGRALVFDAGGLAQTVSFFRYKPGERAYTRVDGTDMDPDPDMNGKRADLLQPGWYQDQIRAQTRTQNTSLFLQDSYSPLTNVTLDAGVRWETQRLTDFQGNTAISMYDLVAPRVGLIVDPTNQGRSKVYGHFGRYYEAIPMDLNDRAFGGEGDLVALFANPADCKTPFDQWQSGNPQQGWRSCAAPPHSALQPLAGENLIVQKKLKGSYTDEIVVGGQYEIFEEFTVGAAYIKRWLGRAIEDAGIAPGQTIVANPGAIPASVVAEYESRAQALEQQAGMPAATPDQKAAAQEARFVADAAKAVASMPKPKRDYDAIQLTAAKRFNKNWMLQASYTYSRTRGNYPGLYAADKGQLDPNYTSLYDAASLLTNRNGALPTDRPHIARLDGYYQYQIGRGNLTTGLGFVARSGRPENTLGYHPIYGQSETFILPRGTAGRTDFVTRLDLHLGYRTRLTDGTTADVFFDVFNLLDQRVALLVDQDYTLDPVESIVGGGKEDLKHLKNAITGDPVNKNPNFLSATAYQAPIAGRFGLRLSF